MEMSIKFNDFASVTLTELGAGVLNDENKRFNETFQKELKTDYKEGDVYSNILWLILSIFAEYYEGKEHTPFTSLKKME